MKKALVIQTAFTGDVVLATAAIEKLHLHHPDAQIDFLLRKGNEGLLQGHPFITNLLVWDKKTDKLANLRKIIGQVRAEGYSHVFNLHRFSSSGIITMLSGAIYKAGFDKNPLSFCYNHKVKHILSEPYSDQPVHEVQRNQAVIAEVTDGNFDLPRLYPTAADYGHVKPLLQQPYICIAPSSVWFTKQFLREKWVSLIADLPAQYPVYLLGAPSDKDLGDWICTNAANRKTVNLCGKLSFLQSAALMEGAAMNYANDSAPLHFATAMNTPLTAVFCSTVPAFGFGPLRAHARVVEVTERLACRPCGLHGLRTCPKGHFKCAMNITNDQLLWWTSKTT